MRLIIGMVNSINMHLRQKNPPHNTNYSINYLKDFFASTVINTVVKVKDLFKTGFGSL